MKTLPYLIILFVLSLPYHAGHGAQPEATPPEINELALGEKAPTSTPCHSTAGPETQILEPQENIRVVLYKRFLAQNPTLDLDQYLYDRYEFRGRKTDLNYVRKQFAHFPTAYRQLFVDPAIIFHSINFISYAKSQQKKGPLPEDPWELRNAFARRLGTTSFYRALALTQDEFESILRNGMQSFSLFVNGETNTPLHRNLTFNISQMYQNRVSERRSQLQRETTDSLLSFTKYKSLALYVGARELKDKKDPNSQLYLFKVRVPKFEILYPEHHGIILDERFHFSSNTESFLPLKVDPREIVSGGPYPFLDRWTRLKGWWLHP